MIPSLSPLSLYWPNAFHQKWNEEEENGNDNINFMKRRPEECVKSVDLEDYYYDDDDTLLLLLLHAA